MAGAAAEWAPPQAPGPVAGEFRVLTRTGAAPQPVLRLSWDPAEPGDFLIAGYRVHRATEGGAWEARGAEGGLVKGPVWDDPVQPGEAYDYVVEAVDVKGLAGRRSRPSRFDLRTLPPALLAPPAPVGVSAVPRRDDVELVWDAGSPWVAPIRGYRVWAADSLEGLAGAAPVDLSGTSWVDSSSRPDALRWYAVASVDAAGRVSPLSATVSAKPTGTLPPGAPVGLTTRSRTERVLLAWEPAPPGTAPVTAYLLSRRWEGEEEWSFLARLGPERREYSDRAPGDRGYVYSLAAVDSEGNTGQAAYVGASPSAKPLNKTLVVLMPTAYANHKDRDRGLNLNVLFDFYVGSLYQSYTSPLTGLERTAQFQPLQVATVSTDAKWALLDDRGFVPGLATGFYSASLINFGQPSGSQTVGISSTGGGIRTLGNVYVAASKRFWPGERRASVHGGLFLGALADTLVREPLPPDWHLTARHLLPGGDLPQLLTRFVDPKLGAQVGQAPHLAFAGVQFPFTVPLGFRRWHTGLRMEYITPLAYRAEYAPSATGLPPPDAAPATQLPWLLNVHVDNLPLFGFEFGFFKIPGGFQLIAFYHIPDLTWSW